MPNVNWLNADGLYVKMGDKEATAGTAGEFGEVSGSVHIIELKIADLTTLTTGNVVVEQNVFIPKGVRIEWVDVMATTAVTSGGSATLNLGLLRTDQSTAIDAVGLLSAAPMADFNVVGETKHYNVGVSGVGSLVGVTTGANVGMLSAKYATAAFTAGAVTIRIGYSPL